MGSRSAVRAGLAAIAGTAAVGLAAPAGPAGAALGDERILFAKKVAYTNRDGRAIVEQRFTKPNRYRPHARKRGFRTGKTTVEVVR
jgi:hypothetical protein